MIHNIILRVFAVIVTSLLINIALIDGLIANLVQVDFKQFSLVKNFSFKLQAAASFVIISLISYLLVLLCFKNFLKMSFKEYETDEEEEEEDEIPEAKVHIGRLIFLDIIPVIILVLLVIFFAFIALSHGIYTPAKSMYHIAPPIHKSKLQKLKNTSKNLKNTVKGLFHLRKKRFFSRLRKKIKKKVAGLPIIRDLPGMSKKRVEYLSWHVLNLQANEKYELDFRYFKLLVVTAVTVFIYVMFFMRLNMCTCCT